MPAEKKISQSASTTRPKKVDRFRQAAGGAKLDPVGEVLTFGYVGQRNENTVMEEAPPLVSPLPEPAPLPPSLEHLQMVPVSQIRPGRYQKRLKEAENSEVLAQLEAQMGADYERGALRLFLFVMKDRDDPAFFNPSRGGHRRVEIAQKLGVPEILCYVSEYDPEELSYGTYFENEGRQDLSIVEKGLMYLTFIEDRDLSQEEVAIQYHVKGGRDYVGRCIRAAKAAKDVQAMIFRDPDRSMRVVDVLSQLDVLEDAAPKRAPIIAAFEQKQLTADGVQIAVSRVLAGEVFTPAEQEGSHPLPLKEIARTERFRSARVGFDRYFREVQKTPPSTQEREELMLLRQKIDDVLALE